MKKVFFVLCVLSFGCCEMSFAQDIQTDNAQIETTECPENYKLYPTENMWTFLKLDTRTGRVWQVQYATSGKNYGEVIVNDKDLTFGDNGAAGRFELYPTKNIYTFMLLDKKNGVVAQLQWSMSIEDRGIAHFISYGN